jgi:hypothetical protein
MAALRSLDDDRPPETRPVPFHARFVLRLVLVVGTGLAGLALLAYLTARAVSA